MSPSVLLYLLTFSPLSILRKRYFSQNLQRILLIYKLPSVHSISGFWDGFRTACVKTGGIVCFLQLGKWWICSCCYYKLNFESSGNPPTGPTQSGTACKDWPNLIKDFNFIKISYNINNVTHILLYTNVLFTSVSTCLRYWKSYTLKADKVTSSFGYYSW